jgi:hypothetical protein
MLARSRQDRWRLSHARSLWWPAVSSPVTIEPVYRPAGFEIPIVLYDGPARLHADGDRIYEGVGQLVFHWRRSPSIKWSFASNDAVVPRWPEDVTPGVGQWLELRDPTDGYEARTDVVPWDNGPAESYAYRASGHQPQGATAGSRDGFSSVIVHIVNFVDQLHAHRPAVETEADGWRIIVARSENTAKVLENLTELGGFGFTHVARIVRLDGSLFGFDDVLPVIEGLWYLLGFAAGAHIGTALPVGLDEEGRVLGVLYRASIADSFGGRLSWLDPTHVHDVGPLFAAWFRLEREPFWSSTIKRAMWKCVTANAASPLDESIVTALSCLELLAWAVLEVEERWLDLPRDGELSLAGRLRLLLRWAGIDPTIPPQLTALAGLTKADNNVTDGPTALTWIRNRSVHPPKVPRSGVPGWPSAEQLQEGWRLALEYANLVILRLLGHTGQYGSRLHTEGRWMGSMTPVPWAEPYDR